MKPKHIKRLQQQSRDLDVHQVDKHTFVVSSTSNPAANHIVTVTFDGSVVRTRCTCPWAINRGIACSHVLAALEYLAARKNRTLSFWTDEDEARRQKHRLFRLRGPHDSIWITSRAA